MGAANSVKGSSGSEDDENSDEEEMRKTRRTMKTLMENRMRRIKVKMLIRIPRTIRYLQKLILTRSADSWLYWRMALFNLSFQLNPVFSTRLGD
ncbi:hypothetical protein JG688_00001744 [Phytophthora aleatoria]|uniref:Uncharacterized protein n=1 Tax=Phytophthora aleatoria TaxID=2496075 RepID=A0A8J5IVI3_9STRA|nr:hypothetical protein JG688_00001744 [Phytophthora aleatoria]